MFGFFSSSNTKLQNKHQQPTSLATLLKLAACVLWVVPGVNTEQFFGDNQKGIQVYIEIDPLPGSFSSNYYRQQVVAKQTVNYHFTSNIPKPLPTCVNNNCIRMNGSDTGYLAWLQQSTDAKEAKQLGQALLSAEAKDKHYQALEDFFNVLLITPAFFNTIASLLEPLITHNYRRCRNTYLELATEAVHVNCKIEVVAATVIVNGGWNLVALYAAGRENFVRYSVEHNTNWPFILIATGQVLTAAISSYSIRELMGIPVSIVDVVEDADLDGAATDNDFLHHESDTDNDSDYDVNASGNRSLNVVSYSPV